jgi:hypothetical protein
MITAIFITFVAFAGTAGIFLLGVWYDRRELLAYEATLTVPDLERLRGFMIVGGSWRLFRATEAETKRMLEKIQGEQAMARKLKNNSAERI